MSEWLAKMFMINFFAIACTNFVECTTMLMYFERPNGLTSLLVLLLAILLRLLFSIAICHFDEAF